MPLYLSTLYLLKFFTAAKILFLSISTLLILGVTILPSCLLPIFITYFEKNDVPIPSFQKNNEMQNRRLLM